MCSNWINQNCKHEERCTYAHGIEELAPLKCNKKSCGNMCMFYHPYDKSKIEYCKRLRINYTPRIKEMKTHGDTTDAEILKFINNTRDKVIRII